MSWATRMGLPPSIAYRSIPRSPPSQDCTRPRRIDGFSGSACSRRASCGVASIIRTWLASLHFAKAGLTSSTSCRHRKVAASAQRCLELPGGDFGASASERSSATPTRASLTSGRASRSSERRMAPPTRRKSRTSCTYGHPAADRKRCSYDGKSTITQGVDATVSAFIDVIECWSCPPSLSHNTGCRTRKNPHVPSSG